MALGHVIGRLEDAPRPGVLDLGGPIGSNVELYARHGARITFADVFRFYEPSETANASDFAAMLPDRTSHIDIILAWDLMNYLSLAEIGWLVARVSESSAPGAVLMSLVACAGSIPETPSQHTILDRETLHITPSGPNVRPSPAYSEQTLLRTFSGMTVKSRFQLRSSMVEYLFSLE